MAVAAGPATSFSIEIVDEYFLQALRLDDDVCIASFIKAYDELNKFVGLLGTIFQFVQKDVGEKTARLGQLMQENPTEYKSVKTMLLYEQEKGVRCGGSALLALHRALEFIVLFLSELASAKDDASLSSICRSSYDTTLSRFHNWLVRKAVALASYTLPNRRQLITSIKEDACEVYVKEVLGKVVGNGQQVYQRVQKMYETNSAQN